nr:PASTA domain-containing protein [uncultured Desulfuromonas sp.]
MRTLLLLRSLLAIVFISLLLPAHGFSYSHDFMAISQHPQEIPSRGLLEVEIEKRHGQAVYEQMVNEKAAARAQDVETFNAVSGPITNSAGGVKEALLKELSKANRGRQIKIIKEIFKTDKKGAVEILQKSGKNFTAVAEKLDGLDKAGTLASVLGALSGGDIVGATEAVTHAAVSGGLATGTAAVSAELGAAVGAMIGGPVGAGVGAVTFAVAGAVASSVAYNEYVAPNVETVGDSLSNQYHSLQEQNEDRVRRIRTDLYLVYDRGYLSATGYIDTDELHAQAQKIREQSHAQRIKNAEQEMFAEVNSVNGMLMVPNVEGKTKKEAEGLIRAAGFAANVVEEQSAPRKELVGKVYSQMPSANSIYPVGSFMTVIALVYADITFEMPGVIGLNVTKARGILESAGLTVPATGAIRVAKNAPDPDSEYKVFAQQPEPTKPVHAGQTVSLSLYGRYAGKTVPSVVGLGKLEATLQMEAAGLRVSTIPGEAAATTDKVKTVQSQSLTVGDPVPAKGGDVVLTLLGSCEKSDRCKANQRAFYAAYQAKKYDRCRSILEQSQDCAFHGSELAALNQLENREQQSDFCQEQLASMDSALRAYNWDRFKGVLAQSKSCSFYNEYLAMAAEAEKRVERNQSKSHDRFHQGIAQIFGSAIHSALSQGRDSQKNSGSYSEPHYLENLSTGKPSKNSSTSSKGIKYSSDTYKAAADTFKKD